MCGVSVGGDRGWCVLLVLPSPLFLCPERRWLRGYRWQVSQVGDRHQSGPGSVPVSPEGRGEGTLGCHMEYPVPPNTGGQMGGEEEMATCRASWSSGLRVPAWFPPCRCTSSPPPSRGSRDGKTTAQLFIKRLLHASRVWTAGRRKPLRDLWGWGRVKGFLTVDWRTLKTEARRRMCSVGGALVQTSEPELHLQQRGNWEADSPCDLSAREGSGIGSAKSS